MILSNHWASLASRRSGILYDTVHPRKSETWFRLMQPFRSKFAHWAFGISTERYEENGNICPASLLIMAKSWTSSRRQENHFVHWFWKSCRGQDTSKSEFRFKTHLVRIWGSRRHIGDDLPSNSPKIQRQLHLPRTFSHRGPSAWGHSMKSSKQLMGVITSQKATHCKKDEGSPAG